MEKEGRGKKKKERDVRDSRTAPPPKINIWLQSSIPAYNVNDVTGQQRVSNYSTGA